MNLVLIGGSVLLVILIFTFIISDIILLLYLFGKAKNYELLHSMQQNGDLCIILSFYELCMYRYCVTMKHVCLNANSINLFLLIINYYTSAFDARLKLPTTSNPFN